MWGDIFFSGGRALGSYFAAANKAKSDRKWQAYNNKMVQLQNAQNQTALSVNEELAQRKHLMQGIQIQKSEFATKAAVEVSAAASGTTGRSVNMMLFDVTRSAGEARSRSREELSDTQLQIHNQRQASAMGAQMSLDLRSIPSPNPLTYLLGFTGDLAKAYERDRYPNRRS